MGRRPLNRREFVARTEKQFEFAQLTNEHSDGILELSPSAVIKAIRQDSPGRELLRMDLVKVEPDADLSQVGAQVRIKTHFRTNEPGALLLRRTPEGGEIVGVCTVTRADCDAIFQLVEGQNGKEKPIE
jgi:hypothetical protein